ncbi:MAG: hypothetical protein DRP29_10225 [Thermodesulfobacteriota bacterium]|nr:MAG: hypothetical protein DRP29_10225 [Thermodesulfobacteriota bacterium]
MKCPGQDTRYWKEDAIFEIECPYCGYSIEFFKDDTVRKCPSCKKSIPNPRIDFSCAAYCKYAEICLDELSSELIFKNTELLKEKVKKAVLERLKDKQIKKKFLQEVEKLGTMVKKENKSLGITLLSYFLSYLSENEREELYRDLKLPEILKKEIEEELKSKNYKVR